jgi:predicted AlkP superfamily phosphohydrolase/phosphomutase
MLALLQFDSASVPLLDRMLDEGRLPTLAALRERGRQVPLGMSTRLFEAATYPTLHTGVDVADHGLYTAYQWSAPEQRVRYWHELDAPEAVWERLARSGRRSLVIDAYQSWPAANGGGGVWLSGWGFRNRVVVPRWSAPDRAFGELARRFGAPGGAETVFGRPWRAGLLRARRALLAAPGRAADAVADLLERERFDLVWVTFGAAHLGGHFFWEVCDAFDGGLDRESRAQLRAAVEDIYAAVDAAMARILASLPPDADVIVLSPDGMGPNTSRSDLLPEMLAAVLGDKRSGTRRGGPRPGTAIWRLRGAVPTSRRAAIARALPAATARNLVTRLQTPPVDWTRTAAFPVSGDYEGYVRLNVRGRERDGIVDPDDTGELMDEIAAGLGSFEDPDGAPSVHAIERLPADMAGGARADQLPDLVVRWSERPTARLPGVTSPRFGDVRRRGGGMGITGNHAEGAWALLLPGTGRIAELGRTPQMLDVAATACALTGADADGLDGESLLLSG